MFDYIYICSLCGNKQNTWSVRHLSVFVRGPLNECVLVSSDQCPHTGSLHPDKPRVHHLSSTRPLDWMETNTKFRLFSWTETHTSKCMIMLLCTCLLTCSPLQLNKLRISVIFSAYCTYCLKVGEMSNGAGSRSLLVHPEDRTQTGDMWHHDFIYDSCGEQYISEVARTLSKKMNVHQRSLKTGGRKTLTNHLWVY